MPSGRHRQGKRTAKRKTKLLRWKEAGPGSVSAGRRDRVRRYRGPAAEGTRRRGASRLRSRNRGRPRDRPPRPHRRCKAPWRFADRRGRRALRRAERRPRRSTGSRSGYRSRCSRRASRRQRRPYRPGRRRGRSEPRRRERAAPAVRRHGASRPAAFALNVFAPDVFAEDGPSKPIPPGWRLPTSSCRRACAPSSRAFRSGSRSRCRPRPRPGRPSRKPGSWKSSRPRPAGSSGPSS